MGCASMTNKEYLKKVEKLNKEWGIPNGIRCKNHGKTILIPKAVYEEMKPRLNETKYKKTITKDFIRFDLKETK